MMEGDLAANFPVRQAVADKDTDGADEMIADDSDGVYLDVDGGGVTGEKIRTASSSSR